MSNNTVIENYECDWLFMSNFNWTLSAKEHPGVFRLTHLLLDKMDAMLADDIFKYIFLNENEKNSDSNFTETCPQESDWQ